MHDWLRYCCWSISSLYAVLRKIVLLCMCIPSCVQLYITSKLLCQGSVNYTYNRLTSVHSLHGTIVREYGVMVVILIAGALHKTAF